jgi:MoxR-like ATPase
MTEGVLLLTTDGDAAHRLTHPSSQVPRTYVATVRGSVKAAAAEIRAGVELEDGFVRPESVDVAPGEQPRTWDLMLTIREGRTREVRRLCEHVGSKSCGSCGRRSGRCNSGRLRARRGSPRAAPTSMHSRSRTLLDALLHCLESGIQMDAPYLRTRSRQSSTRWPSASWVSSMMVERLLIACSPAGTSCWRASPASPRRSRCARSPRRCTRASAHPVHPDLLPADVIGTQVFDQTTASFGEARADLRQHRAGRRDQSRAGQGAGRAARGDAGEAGHDRRHELRSRSRSWCWPRRTRSSRKAPTRCRKRRWTASCSSCGSAIPRAPRRRRSCAAWRRRVHPGGGGGRRRRSCSRRAEIAALHLDDRLVDYIVDLVHATRCAREAGLADLAPLVEYGASPRATIALAQAARAHAFLRGRDFVSPDDVKAIAPDVLRHRVLTDVRGRGGERHQRRSSSRASSSASPPRDARRGRPRPHGAVPPESSGRSGASSCARAGSSTRASPASTTPSSRGMGMEFAEVREYQPGDEVRTIDWNVSARMRRLFVKRFVEERELTVLLLVDSSGSSRGGAGAQDKRGWRPSSRQCPRAHRHAQQRSRWAAHALRPRGARRAAQEGAPARAATRARCARLARSSAAPISAPPATMRRASCRTGASCSSSPTSSRPTYERPLTRLARRHDVVAVVLDDPAERELPNVGVARLVDTETGRARGGRHRRPHGPRSLRLAAARRTRGAAVAAAAPRRGRSAGAAGDAATWTR